MKNKKAKRSTRRTVRAPHDPTGPPISEATEKAEEHEHGHRAKPVSIWPLDFETAMRGLVAVKWPTKRKTRSPNSS